MADALSLSILCEAAGEAPSVAAFRAACKSGAFPLVIEGAEGGLRSILLSLFARELPSDFPLLVVCPTDIEATALAADLQALGIPAVLFPWWGALPYRDIAPLSPVFAERTRALALLCGGNSPVIITTERAYLTPIPPPEYLRSLLLTLRPGDAINTTELARTLALWGYTRVQRVQVPGEFVLRGEVLDVYQGGDERAYRILFDFDKVESIKQFDVGNQSGIALADSLCLRPMKEVVWTDDRIETLSKRLASFEEFPTGGAAYIDNLISRRTVSGEEMLFPFAFEENSTLEDYLPDKNAVTVFVERERLERAQESLENEFIGLHLRSLREKETPAPHRILLKFVEVAAHAKRQVSFCASPSSLKIIADPPRSFFGNINYMKEEFAALLAQNWRLVIAAESETQAERIRELFAATVGRSGASSKILVLSTHLSSGFALPEIKLLVVQENEIFGRRDRPPKSLKSVRSAAIDSFVELNPGDYVVHLNYGIGLFKGIDRIKAMGYERDYIKLEYAGEDTVFVPIEQVNLIQRYIGNEGAPPRIDKLGSKSWNERKARAARAAEELAGQLVILYAKRKAEAGFAFPKDGEWQTMFEASFPFDETEDQLRCVTEIKADMEKPYPMDRLVCGDVGYGKTEVAVRACFKAVMGGKQVAFLAPTTILVEQHFETFCERFANFPVKIAMLSRFVDGRAIRKTLEAVKAGAIDILIGTHRIIQKDVAFKDLGLLVIDEEQRFGVKDKERLKEFKHNVDCLALSATPIPRTLHMSLLKIRDMSLLATPPRNRHPIETVVDEWNDALLVQAIRREIERGGQVFFLHNRIESLDETRLRVERLMPEILVETAHGQMDAQALEDIMHRFIHGGFHVLVSTTIIENGIDIPNVNTIIIDRADMYGVSQLYQLRGRVGRSDRVAYAYLFYPHDRALSEPAMKRLQAISDFTELGSGFKIAMKDMEIRGAGNLLGREQSGNILSVGFDLYMRLLDEAIARLENEHYEAEIESLLELEYTGFIPDSYISSAQEKMDVYKKIAAIREAGESERLYEELVDRFGPLPDEAASLLALADIRVICRALGVSSLREKAGVVRVEFAKVAKVSVERLVRLMQGSAGRVKLDPKAPNVIILQTGLAGAEKTIGLKEKSEFIREKLEALAG